MNWLEILNGALGVGGLGVIILRLIDIYSTRAKVQAETKKISSEEKENTVEAAQLTVKVLQDGLTFLRDDNREYKERVEVLEANQKQNTATIQELMAHRDERTKQIDELTKLTSEQAENNEALTAQVAALRAQIARDTAETRELVTKYQELKEFTKDLLKFLEQKGVDFSDFSGKIPESIAKWRYPKR